MTDTASNIVRTDVYAKDTASISTHKYIPDEYFEFKARIHDRLLDLIDLSMIDTLDRQDLIVQIRQVVEHILREESYDLPLNLQEREKIFTEVLDEVLGLGPLEPFLKDPYGLRYSGQYIQTDLRGKIREAGTHRRPVQR